MTRAKRKNSFTVAYSTIDGEVCYGLLEKLICINGNNLAVIKVLNKTLSRLNSELHHDVILNLLEDFISVEETQRYVVVEISQVLKKCFNTSVSSHCTQLTHSVNSIEVIL